MYSTTNRRTSTRTRLLVGPIAVAAVLAAGCSSGKDYQGSAEKLIETELADTIGLGDLSAGCDDVPDSAEVGDTFACRADTKDGQTITFVAEITSEDEISVDTTNLITPEGLGEVEKSAVAALEAQVGQTLGVENFDCGDQAIVFDPAEDTLACELTDPTTGDVYDAEVTLSSLDKDADVSVVVAEEPKG